jgi:GNAT superfamily N-acetyltransferase
VFVEHADGAFFTVEHKRKIVGRVAAFVDHLVSDSTVGIIGFFESIDDRVVARDLFAKAEEWLAAKGRSTIRGPLSPSLAGSVGVQVDGRNGYPTLMMAYNPPYYRRLFEENGYEKGRDFLSYQLDPNGLDEARLRSLNDRLHREGFRFRAMKKRRLKAEMRAFCELHNVCWNQADHYAFSPLTRREAEHPVASMKTIADMDLTVIAERNGELVGGLLGLPDANPAIRCLNGKLGPIRLLKFLLALRNVKQMRFVDLVIAPNCQRHGLATSMVARAVAAAKNKGYKFFEYSWVVEDNLASRQIAERFGGRETNRFRVYEKAISQTTRSSPTPSRNQALPMSS